MRPCKVCGAKPELDIPDGWLRDLRQLLGPRQRLIPKTWRVETLCWDCCAWAARIHKVIA